MLHELGGMEAQQPMERPLGSRTSPLPRGELSVSWTEYRVFSSSFFAVYAVPSVLNLAAVQVPAVGGGGAAY